MIILEKAKEEEILSKCIANMTAQAEVAQVLSLIDLLRRFNWAMSNIDLEVAKKRRLTGIKKY